MCRPVFHIALEDHVLPCGYAPAVPLTPRNAKILASDPLGITSRAENARISALATLNKQAEKPLRNSVTVARPNSTVVGNIGEEAEEKSGNPHKNLQVDSGENHSVSADVLEQNLARLRVLGYHGLVKRIGNIQDYPWREILTVEHPEHIEQLVDLYELIELKSGQRTEQEKQRVLRFATELARTKPKDTDAILGRLIYLLNESPQMISDKVLEARQEEALRYIHDAFRKKLEAAKSSLSFLRHIHKKTAIQSSEVVPANQLAIIAANSLLPDTGRINFGLFEDVAEFFAFAGGLSKEHESEFRTVLNRFSKTPQFREQLHAVKKPESEESPANVVIRSTLGIPYFVPLNNIDAQRTALASLLSHLRQGKDGSCFATPLAIVLLKSHSEKCLEDFSALLGSAKITRRVNNVIQDFPFLLRISEKNLDKVLELDAKGRILSCASDPTFVWEAPGIISACRAMNIELTKDAIEDVLEHYEQSDPSKKGRHRLTVKILLQELANKAKTIPRNSQEGLGTLYLKGCFAFQSQESNPLLHVWENAIAGMAEADESGMVRSTIVSCVAEVLNAKIRTACRDNPALKKLLRQSIRTELSKRLHLQYDPMIFSDDTSQDEHSTEGAFVLYDKNHCSLPASWVRIDSPTAFQGFISRILEEAKKSVKSQKGEFDKSLKKDFSRIVDVLCQYAGTTDFVVDCLRQYYPQNAALSDPLQHYANIKYAPWVTKCGNNFSKVIQVYLEDFQKSKWEHCYPLTVDMLFEKVYQMGISRCKETDAECNAPRLIPARIPGLHAFNIMLDHPSLSGLWKQDRGSAAWLFRKVVLPGKKFAESPIDPASQKKFVDHVLSKLVPPGKTQEMQRILEAMPLNMAVKDLREKVLQTLLDMPIDEISSPREVALTLDGLIVESLTEAAHRSFSSSVVHFADTNWTDGSEDVHFCLLVNPGNGALEMWSCTGNGKKMFPMGQERWIRNSQWEFFTSLDKISAIPH